MRKNLRLGTELSLAGVRLTPANGVNDGEGGSVLVDVVVVVVDGDVEVGETGGVGARSFFVGFFAATGFDAGDGEDAVLGELPSIVGDVEELGVIRPVLAKTASKGGVVAAGPLLTASLIFNLQRPS